MNLVNSPAAPKSSRSKQAKHTNPRGYFFNHRELMPFSRDLISSSYLAAIAITLSP